MSYSIPVIRLDFSQLPQRPDGVNGQYGYYADLETGLVLMTNRYYDPGTGRFLTRDPIGYGGGINLYGFVGNNPVTGADPEGMRPLTADDRTRLHHLLEYGQSSKKLSVTTGIAGAVKEIKAAIGAVDGANDPVALKATFWAIDRLGNSSYGQNGTLYDGYNEQVLPKQWKCNIFAADAYAYGGEIGWDGPRGVPTNVSILGNHHPYAANDLADRSVSVHNFPTVDGRKRQIGDIAAFLALNSPGHTTLYLGAGMCIYAGPDAVKIDSIAYVHSGHADVTYRRYRR